MLYALMQGYILCKKSWSQEKKEGAAGKSRTLHQKRGFNGYELCFGSFVKQKKGLEVVIAQYIPLHLCLMLRLS